MAATHQAGDVRRLALLGGVLGLGVGLVLWAWSATRPGPSPTAGAGAGGGSASSGPSAAPRPSTGVLSDDDAPATTASAPGTEPGESPRALGVRFSWSARFLENDFEGALATIEGAQLQEEERLTQLGELADALVPRDWVDPKAFPFSSDVAVIYRQPEGRDLLARRWSSARSAVRALGETPRKVQLLSRMELVARILDEAPRLAEGAPGARPLRPIEEVDASGNPVPSRAPEASAHDLPILDYASESKALRDEARAALQALDATPHGSSIAHYFGAGWGLVRAGLLSTVGALVAAVGGLLVRAYSLVIVRNLARFSAFREALAAGADADPVAGPPDEE